jgi:NAD(P)-dependent dehydrogenase (short-subunit alcohol dehydrogenase family)
MSSPRTILITGASRGLGLETARQLAQRRHRVVLTARDGAQAAQAARSLGGDATGRALDVSQAASIAHLVAELERDGITLDVLVNNAGASFSGFDAGVARRTLATNYFGARDVTDALAPLIADGGAIVMVSSGMGQLDCLSPDLAERFARDGLGRGELDQLMNDFVTSVEDKSHARRGFPSSAYSVSKVGLNALTRVLARELAPRAIRVNAVCPGWVRTDMGGRSAPRSVEEGARGIVWAATLASDGPTGGFFRDAQPIDW